MSRWIVFDLGGVLVRITLNVAEAAAICGVSLPSTWEAERFTDLPSFQDYQAGRLTCDGYLDSLASCLEAGRPEADALHDAIVIEAYPGAFELLEDLRRQGFKLGILSNTNSPHWEKIRPYGLFQRVDLAMGSHQVALEKPDPAIYKEFARQAGEGEFFFLDDSQANVAGAIAAGWQAEWVDERQGIAGIEAVIRRWRGSEGSQRGVVGACGRGL